MVSLGSASLFPQITFIPADTEAERFLDHKPMVLPQKDAGWVPQQGNVCAPGAGREAGDSSTFPAAQNAKQGSGWERQGLPE